MVQPKTLLISFLFLSLLVFIESKHDNHEVKEEEEEIVLKRSMFPNDFIFGVATSAYQASSLSHLIFLTSARSYNFDLYT